MAFVMIDELDALRRFDSPAALLASEAEAGQCELIAGSMLQASAWHRGSVGEKAGGPIPDWSIPDPLIRCNPVTLFRLRNAFYAPAFGAVIAADGGVMKRTVSQAQFLTPDLSALPYVQRDGDQLTFRPPSDVPRLAAGIVSMPWGAIYNYGHFVCDCLTSLAVLPQLLQLGTYSCFFPTLKPWQRRHVELLGVIATELDQPLYCISDALFMSGMSYFLNAPNTNYRLLRDIQLRNKRATDVSIRKIYITRSRITQSNPDRRRFLSEVVLEDKLRALGYAIVAPELLDIDEQIDLFRNADIIVSCRGAALANTVYCHADATVVEIIPTVPGFEGYQWVRDICAIVGCRWRPYFTAGIPPENPVVTAGQIRPNAGFTFDIHIPDLIDFVELLETKVN